MASATCTCSKCNSTDWKSAKMVMLEGVSSSDGSMDGVIRERGVFGKDKVFDVGAFFLSDRWFDFDKFSTTSSIKFETVTGLAKAVEREVAAKGAHLRIPNPPTEPRKPSEPFWGRPSEVKPLQEPVYLPPEEFSMLRMFWQKRGGDLFLIALVTAIYFGFSEDLEQPIRNAIDKYWQPYGLLGSGILIAYLLSGFLGLETFNERRFDKAEQKFKRKRKLEQDHYRRQLESKAAQDEKYAKYLSNLELWEAKHKKWKQESDQWKEKVSEIEAQRLNLWESLRVCLRCANVYECVDEG